MSRLSSQVLVYSAGGGTLVGDIFSVGGQEKYFKISICRNRTCKTVNAERRGSVGTSIRLGIEGYW